MKKMIGLAGAGLMACGLALLPRPAHAAIACNAEGVCWHVNRHYVYAPGYGVVVHPNGWHWGPGEHYVFREHVGRGYWRNGIWVRF